MALNFIAICLFSLFAAVTSGQESNDTLGLYNGFLTYQTSSFTLQLVKNSQILTSLVPNIATDFDFLPNYTFLERRATNYKYHTGDLIFRYRTLGSSQWINQDTTASRMPVTTINSTTSSILASADLTPTLNNSLLDVTRTWGLMEGDLTLTFELKNNQKYPIELGGLGFPMESDSIFTNRTAVDINANCSLIDPNIGLDGGYLRYTRINGANPAMVVTPLNLDTSFEGWGFLMENDSVGGSTGYQTETFEGLYQYMPHTLAYIEEEWNATEPWNVPTSKTLVSGETLTAGLRFTVVDEIENIESTVASLGVPVAKGVPGYIVPQDTTAKLYLTVNAEISSVITDPPNSFAIQLASPIELELTPTSDAFGRVRLTIEYKDGKNQVVHYHVSKSAPEAILAVGQYLNTKHWWTNNGTPDRFGRAPSFMLIDHSDGVGELVLQEARVWLCGECHEAGASWLTAAIKQVAQPDASQVANLEAFAHEVLWKTIQIPSLGVRQSIFWYDPNITNFVYDPSIDWILQTSKFYSNSWNAATANVTTRSYGYIYPGTAYWSLYRVGRTFPEMLTQAPWGWYLNMSYQTVKYCFEETNGTHLQPLWYDGLMGETFIGELLKDLYREGWTAQAQEVESLMLARVNLWNVTAIPFGSELGWDCTGQEGVFYWSNYFSMEATVNKTIDTILGYMPTVNHWGYNGNARRYWDFQFDSKLDRIERQVHHYGSALNALAMNGYYRATAGAAGSYILRLALAGMFAPLTNIHEDGFASTAFHSWASTLAWDNYTGDYGPGFVGMVLGSSTIVAPDEQFGLTAFGGELSGSSNSYVVQPRDPVRRRMYIQPLDLFIELDAGAIQSLEVSGKQLTLQIAQSVTQGVASANQTVLWLNQDFYWNATAAYDVSGEGLGKSRGGWLIPLRSPVTQVVISGK